MGLPDGSSQGCPSLPANVVNSNTAVGRIPMKVSVDPQGSSIVDIPIDIPLTTTRLKPKIAISYHSSKASSNGLLGTGFYLKGFSNIHPCPKNIFNDGVVEGLNLDGEDNLCLDGERMIKIGDSENGNTVYTTQKNSMTRVQKVSGSNSDSFLVHRSDGSSLFYQSLKTDVSGKKVLSWARNKVEDLLGNYYTVSFDNDFQVSHLDLTMNSRKGTTNYARVSFTYEARQDVVQRYIAGYAYKPMTKRLSEIDISVEGKTKIKYLLKYTQSCSNGASQLISLTKCGSDGKCLPPDTFNHDQNCLPKFKKSEYKDLPIELSEQLSFANLDLQRIHSGSFGGKNGLSDFYVIEGFSSEKATYDSMYLRNADGSFTKKNGLNTIIRGQIAEAEFDLGRYKFMDFTGNGYQDIYMVSSEKDGCKADVIYINDGKGNYPKTVKGPVTCISSELANAVNDLKRFRFADFTGNGIPEVYYIQGIDGAKVDDLFIYVNENWKQTEGIESSIVQRTESVDFGRLRVLDFNGDGKMDIHYINAPIGGSSKDTIYISKLESTGDGDQTAFTPYDGPVTTLSPSLNWAGLDISRVKYGDFNGDGLMDIYYQTGRGDEAEDDIIYLNEGRGSFSKIKGLSTVVSGVIAEAELDLMRLKTMAINNDRCTDIYYVNWNGKYEPVTDDIYLCQQFQQALFRRYPGPQTQIPPGKQQAKLTLSSFQFASIVGSGYNDLLVLQQKKSPNLFISDFRDPQLTKVMDGFGETTGFEYEPLTSPNVYQFSEPSFEFPVRMLSSAMYVVSKLSRDDGIGGSVDTLYGYQDGKFHMQGLGFLGFGKITQTNTNTKIYKEMSFTQDYQTYLSPRLIQSKTYSDKKVLINQQDMTYKSQKSHDPSLDSATVFSVYSSEKTTLQYDQAGNFLSTSHFIYSYDKYWNLVEEDATTKDSFGIYQTKSKTTYTQNLDKWILSLQTSHSITYSTTGPCCVKGGTSTKTIKFERDVNTGLVTSSTEMPDDKTNLCKKTDNTYDIFGNQITKKTYSCSNSSDYIMSSVTYDPSGRYITEETNAAGFKQSFIVDTMFGVNILNVDELGVKTIRELDSLGRLTSTKTFANTVNMTLSWCSTVPNSVYCQTTTATTGEKQTTIYDRLGREIQKMSSSLNKNLIESVQYDTNGRRISETAPYFEGDQPLWNKHEYDVFGRRTKTVDINGHVDTWTYINSTSTFINAANQKIVTVKNAKECVMKRIDSFNSATFYKYDSRNNLVETTDPNNNHIGFEYDLNNRKIMEYDPDAGKITYKYDYRGNVIQKTYNDGTSIEMKYDLLNRMTERTVDGKTAEFVYDQQYVGTLSSFSFPNNDFSRKLKYDQYGRLVGSTSLVSGISEPLVISLQYDSRNRISKKTFPNGVSVCYVYNSFGFQTEITDCNGTTYQEIDSLNSFGSVYKKKFGNGISLTIDRLNDNKLSGINSISHEQKQIQALVYHYDNIGRLTNRSDTLQGLTESFRYDILNRVTGSHVNGEFAYDYEYDSLGNIVSKSNVGSYYYEGGRPHAVSQICIKVPSQCFNLKYDGKGNMISQGGDYSRTITYNTENKPLTIESSGVYSISFTYDPFGKRYQRSDKTPTSASTTYYIGGDYEVYVEDDTVLEKVYVTPSIIHEKTKKNLSTSTSVLYVLRDHLYSVDVITDETGKIIKRESYDSFGRTRDPHTWQPNTDNSSYPLMRNGYTNQEELWITGLIHMNGRLYDPQIGRFMSCDPLVQNVLNLQNFNRYSYALNNPLVTTDPSGYSFFSHFFHSIKKAIGHLIHHIEHMVSHLWHEVVNVVKSAIFQTIVKLVIDVVGLVLSPFTGGASILICAALEAAYTGLCVELDGGTFVQALEDAAIDFAEEVVTHEIGVFFQAVGATSGMDQLIESALVHGVEGAGDAEIHHQSPLYGFVNGFAGTLLDGLPSELHLNSFEMELYGGIKTGILGGINSWEHGGSFMNGAIQAEKGFLLNEAEKMAGYAWKMVINPSSKTVTWHKGHLSADAMFSKGLQKAGDAVTGVVGKIGGDFNVDLDHVQLHFNLHSVFTWTQHGLSVNCEGTITAFEKKIGPFNWNGHQTKHFSWNHNYKKAKNPLIF